MGSQSTQVCAGKASQRHCKPQGLWHRRVATAVGGLSGRGKELVSQRHSSTCELSNRVSRLHLSSTPSGSARVRIHGRLSETTTCPGFAALGGGPPSEIPQDATDAGAVNLSPFSSPGIWDPHAVPTLKSRAICSDFQVRATWRALCGTRLPRRLPNPVTLYPYQLRADSSAHYLGQALGRWAGFGPSPQPPNRERAPPRRGLRCHQ